MPAEAPVASTPAGSRWQCLVAAHAAEPRRLVLVQSDRYPDGTRIALLADAADAAIADRAWCVVTYVDDRVAQVHPTPLAAPKAPPLWFAELRESAARPPAVNLVAFTGHGRPVGAVLDSSSLSNVDVTSADQLGAVRWYPATGEVDQIYVQPDRRRQSVASALIAAASGLAAARDWPRLWGDGQRTAMGEALRNGSSWRQRAAPLTHIAPPMTPGDPAAPRESVRSG